MERFFIQGLYKVIILSSIFGSVLRGLSNYRVNTLAVIVAHMIDSLVKAKILATPIKRNPKKLIQLKLLFK